MDTDDDRLDLLLRALADRGRRALLDRLRDAPGLRQADLQDGFAHSRQALSKHLALLEEAGLVVPVWRGRDKLHYLNPVPLQALPARWVTASPREDQAALGALRRALGAQAAGADHGGPPAAGPPPRPVPNRSGPATRAGAAPVDDPLDRLLRRPPDERLQGQPVADGEALRAACAYLADTALAVQGLLQRLAPHEGYEQPADGGFSLAANLWHLADIESLGWRPRFERILAEPQPALPGVDGDRLAIERRYQQRPWRGAARRFVAERRRTLAALARFDAEVLARPVRFAGARTRAGSVVAAAVAHDLDHRPAIASALADRPAS